MNFVKNFKSDTTKVAVLGIIPRKDTFNCKTKQVNETLKKICEEENIPFIPHHGNNTRFHLKRKGATCLAQDFEKFLFDIEFG